MNKKSATGIFALLFKLGPKILSLLGKMAKFLKVGKVGLATASLASYSYLFTWKFAAMIMILLFVHENGHLWAMKHYKMKTKGIYFIPFVGGAAVADDAFPSRGAESYIAIMGPIWGLGITLTSAAIYFATLNPIFAATASWMALINLFNLLPINPLDGGRIFKSIVFSLNVKAGYFFLAIGLIGCLALTFFYGAALFLLIGFIGSLDLLFELRNEKYATKLNLTKTKMQRELRENDDLSPEQRAALKSATEDIEKDITRISPLNDQAKKMTVKTILLSAASYIFVAGILWLVMVVMQHEPGAAAAMELLK
jgi:Zn-dependent protease